MLSALIEKAWNAILTTQGMRFRIDVILVCIRWYAAYPLSYHHLEEMMEERGMCRPLLDQPLGDPVSSLAGKSLSQAQAPGEQQLAHERDLYQGQRCLEIPVPCG